MSDRPLPPPPPGPGDPDAPATGVYASSDGVDAVFEDLDGAGRPDAAPLETVPVDWLLAAPPPGRPSPAAPPLPSDPLPDDPPRAAPPEAPAVQVGDPFAEPDEGAGSGDGAAEWFSGAPEPRLDYDPVGGFRIDFDDVDGAEPPGGDGAASAEEATTALARRPNVVPLPVGPAPPVLPPRAEARRSLRDKARMLRRYRGTVLGATLLGLALAAALALLREPTYTAHSVLLVAPDPGQDRFGGVPGGEESRLMNQALVLRQAPAIAERTAEALLDRPDAGSLAVVRDAAERFGAPVTAAALAEHLQDRVVTVEQAEEESDALRVEASATSPEEAALVAGLYTDEYRALTRAAGRERATQTRRVLDAEIARREARLADVEGEVERFTTQANAAGLDEQTRAAVSQIGGLQGQLDLARVEAQTRAAQLRQLEADLRDVPTRLATSAEAPSAVETTALDAEIAELERLVEQVYLRNPDLRRNPSAHPDLAALDVRLRRLRAERRQSAGVRTGAAVAAGGLDLGSGGANGQAYLADLRRQISQTRAALEGARAQAAALDGRIADARGQLRAVPAQQARLARLDRQRAATAATLDGLRAERDAVALAEATEFGLVQAVREVRVPREPAGPGPSLTLALGGALGLLAGLAGAAVRYRTDSRAHTPDDLRDHGFAVVGTVPPISRTDATQVVEGTEVTAGLVTLSRPFAPEAEAFRHLHAALYDGGGAAPQVVLVTGPDRRSGKSLVAANLAVAAAQAGRRVLLVDADLRQPTVAALLGLEGRPPLGGGPEGANLDYWSTPVPSLFAMTPHRAVRRPDETWAPHQIGALLHNLRAAFDLVLIDAPAALAQADAALLAPHADAALLVAQTGRSDLDALAQVATELAGVGLVRVGAVLNRFDARRAVGYRATAGVRHGQHRLFSRP